MRLALLEDQTAANFSPLSLTRPVFELVCGHYCLRERLLRCWTVTEWGVVVRDYLAETYRELHPEARVNRTDWWREGPVLVVNGRWLPDATALAGLPDDVAGYVDDVPVYATLQPEEATLCQQGGWQEFFPRLARLRQGVPAGGVLLNRPWDLVENNPGQISLDFQLRKLGGMVPQRTEQVACLGDSAWIHVHETARVDPFVVLDARTGPISIDAGAVVQPFTRLEGPCHVGYGTQLFRAHIRSGTTLGPVCRIGGEVEACIMQGYSNKYHDGFLGHSYIGAWVNLGAETTNSDLKNDYTHVQVPLEGVPISSGLTKVGSYIGDHTKTALGSLFNTGSSVGVMCQILPGGPLLPKHIPSFTTIWHGQLAAGQPLEKLFPAARAAMRRRDHELSEAEIRLLQHVHFLTRTEREQALAKAEAKQKVARTS